MMNSRITAPSGESFTSRVQPLRALACPDEAPSEGVARRSSHPRRPPPLGHSTGETAGTAVGSFGSRSVTQAMAHASNDLSLRAHNHVTNTSYHHWLGRASDTSHAVCRPELCPREELHMRSSSYLPPGSANGMAWGPSLLSHP